MPLLTSSYILVDILEKLGIGVPGKNLFASIDVPPEPDEIVLVRIDGTIQPDLRLIDMQQPGFRIICRDSIGYQQRCELQAGRIRRAFREVGGESFVDDGFIKKLISIEHLFGPMDISSPEDKRPLFRADYYMNIS